MIISATDRKTSILPFGEQIARVAEAGPDMLILTERDLLPEEYRELAAACMSECAGNNVQFCADKFADAARELGIKTLHMDLEDLKTSRPDGFDRILTTVRNEREAIDAEAAGASILIFRDVFDLTCKSCRNAKGLAMLRFLLGTVDIPVIGAGGIYPDVFYDVLGSEAAGVCMRDGFMRTKDPSSVVRAYREAEERARKLR
ncbi:MAG: thiamine phosphate synthase [Candidatus Methanoplasma sp.]|jgi:thiamine-phosphate pyrophosphorylase|nr:thiamine phosphate synthase [Candidatus Methanoplasma sp.]